MIGGAPQQKKEVSMELPNDEKVMNKYLVETYPELTYTKLLRFEKLFKMLTIFCQGIVLFINRNSILNQSESSEQIWWFSVVAGSLCVIIGSWLLVKTYMSKYPLLVRIEMEGLFLVLILSLQVLLFELYMCDLTSNFQTAMHAALIVLNTGLSSKHKKIGAFFQIVSVLYIQGRCFIHSDFNASQLVLGTMFFSFMVFQNVMRKVLYNNKMQILMKTRNQLNSVRQFYNDLLGLIPQGLTLLDSDSNIIYANSRVTEILQCETQDIFSILMNLSNNNGKNQLPEGAHRNIAASIITRANRAGTTNQQGESSVYSRNNIPSISTGRCSPSKSNGQYLFEKHFTNSAIGMTTPNPNVNLSDLGDKTCPLLKPGGGSPSIDQSRYDLSFRLPLTPINLRPDGDSKDRGESSPDRAIISFTDQTIDTDLGVIQEKEGNMLSQGNALMKREGMDHRVRMKSSFSPQSHSQKKFSYDQEKMSEAERERPQEQYTNSPCMKNNTSTEEGGVTQFSSYFKTSKKSNTFSQSRFTSLKPATLHSFKTTANRTIFEQEKEEIKSDDKQHFPAVASFRASDNGQRQNLKIEVQQSQMLESSSQTFQQSMTKTQDGPKMKSMTSSHAIQSPFERATAFFPSQLEQSQVISRQFTDFKPVSSLIDKSHIFSQEKIGDSKQKIALSSEIIEPPSVIPSTQKIALDVPSIRSPFLTSTKINSMNSPRLKQMLASSDISIMPEKPRPSVASATSSIMGPIDSRLMNAISNKTKTDYPSMGSAIEPESMTLKKCVISRRETKDSAYKSLFQSKITKKETGVRSILSKLFNLNRPSNSPSNATKKPNEDDSDQQGLFSYSNSKSAEKRSSINASHVISSYSHSLSMYPTPQPQHLHLNSSNVNINQNNGYEFPIQIRTIGNANQDSRSIISRTSELNNQNLKDQPSQTLQQIAESTVKPKSSTIQYHKESQNRQKMFSQQYSYAQSNNKSTPYLDSKAGSNPFISKATRRGSLFNQCHDKQENMGNRNQSIRICS